MIYNYTVRVALPSRQIAEARRELRDYLQDILTGEWEMGGTVVYAGCSLYCILWVVEKDDVARLMLLPDSLCEKVKHGI